MSTHRNRVQMTVSGTPGTGTITLNAASSGYQSFATAYGGNATVDILITEGTAWEVARDCAYTNSGTTVTRGTLEASSTGSAVSFTSAAVVSVIATADRGRTWDAASLNTQVAGTDANTMMAVNTLYTVDMSAWATADRTYTLPATAAVGDRIGVMVTAGNASFELILTAGTGDTLNGIAGGTEWSRVFIANEVVIMRCVTANAAWVVEYDGRISQNAKMCLTTAADGEAASTYTLPTSASTPGAWTDEYDNSNLTSTSNSRIYVRRAGLYSIAVAYAPKDVGVAGNWANIEIRKNGTTIVGGPSATLTTGVNRIASSFSAELPAGEYFDYYYRTQAGGLGTGISVAGDGDWRCTFAITEVLP